MAPLTDGPGTRWKTRFDVLATFYPANATAPAIRTVSIHRFRSDGAVEVPALDSPGIMPARMATRSIVFLIPQARLELTAHFPVPDPTSVVNQSLPQLDKDTMPTENQFRGPLVIFRTTDGRYKDVDESSLQYVTLAAFFIARFGCNPPEGPVVIGPPGPGRIKGARG